MDKCLFLRLSNMKAKKSFGQHFLNNDLIAEEIAMAISDISLNANVLEIGPGKGMLTKQLIKLNKNLKLVELDRDMIPILKNKFPSLEIRQEDFLKTSLEEVFDGEAFCLIGNYPYNISSQIVFKMLDFEHLIPLMVGMFQKEVAERIISGPGSKKFGVISVFTQVHYSGELILNVGKEQFDPPPKVESAVIKLVRKKEKFKIDNPKLFRSIVKQSFGTRRKMIRKCIKSFIPESDFLKQEKLNLRPESLSTKNFVDLSNEVNTILEKRK